METDTTENGVQVEHFHTANLETGTVTSGFSYAGRKLVEFDVQNHLITWGDGDDRFAFTPDDKSINAIRRIIETVYFNLRCEHCDKVAIAPTPATESWDE